MRFKKKQCLPKNKPRTEFVIEYNSLTAIGDSLFFIRGCGDHEDDGVWLIGKNSPDFQDDVYRFVNFSDTPKVVCSACVWHRLYDNSEEAFLEALRKSYQAGGNITMQPKEIDERADREKCELKVFAGESKDNAPAEVEDWIAPAPEKVTFTGAPVEGILSVLTIQDKTFYYILCSKGGILLDEHGENIQADADRAYCFSDQEELRAVIEIIKQDKDRKEKYGDWLLVNKLLNLKREPIEIVSL